MNRLLVVGVWLFVVGASSAEAQTLVLCDAEWMDVERVLALITVEVDEPARYVFRVTDCTEESATVAVSGPEGLSREREVRLATTATEARSRLVALVLVEMVRLGTRERPEPSEAVAEDREPTTDAEDREPTTDTDDRAPTTDTDDREPTTDTGEPTTEPESVAPYERFESAEAIEPPPEVTPTPDPEPEPTPDCTVGGLAGRLSARGCSSSLGIDVGTTRHQLQQRDVRGSLWMLQLRARYRWRFLLVGARVAGRVNLLSNTNGAELGMATYTAQLGFETGSVRFEHALIAFALFAEAGVVRWRWEDGVDVDCFDPGHFPTRCSSGPRAGRRPTFGGLASFRVEFPIRSGGLSLEVEGGWMRGVMVTEALDPLGGVGGAQLSLLLGATFGLGGAS